MRSEALPPVGPVGAHLPALGFGDAGQFELPVVETGIGLGDALPLLMEQLLQRRRLLKAAFGELRLGLGDGVLSPFLQCRQQVDDVLMGEREGAADDGVGGATAAGERRFQLVERRLLAGPAQRTERFRAAAGLPSRGR